MYTFFIITLILVNSYTANASCDFSRLAMEECFIQYHSSADRLTETDPICGVNLSRLDRVKMCVKLWEKHFLKPKFYLPPRNSSYLGRILTPESDWHFNNECVQRRVTFQSGIDHADMMADVFECPMSDLQFEHFQTMSNFYISYGSEPNSVFYYNNVLENLALTPKKDENGTILIKIENWLNNLNRIPDLEREQLM